MEIFEQKVIRRRLGSNAFAKHSIARRAPYIVLFLSLAATGAALLAIGPDQIPLVIIAGLAVSIALFAITYAGLRAQQADRVELEQARRALAQHTERLRILHEIDHAVADKKTPEAIAGAIVQPLRELLGVPRAIVNLFDLNAGEVEWLAAAGRQRVHVGPGVRYPMRLMGDIDGLKRGEAQLVDTHALSPSPETEALLASGVHVYMVVPMIAGGELIGALSFGGEPGPFPPEQINIAKEVATQFAIAITQARLYDRIKRHADELEVKVRERTRELDTAHAELQHRNTELLQLATQLQASNKELQAFSYSVSHDLRAPLRGIDGFSRVLLDDYSEKLDDTGRRYLGRIRAGAQRMGNLIDDMLKLAQVTRAELRRQRVNLSDIARATVDDLRNGEPHRNVDCEIEDGLFVDADTRLVRVLMDNLLGNAWKFTSKHTEPRIAFGAEPHDGTLAYYVRDNGAGFDMAYAEKLFHPFQRLHSEADFSGTGIGLATVYRIVTRHGGRVWAESTVNGGTRFYFTLPLHTAA